MKPYADPVPMFQRYGAEDQLTAMYDPVVQLKSGGYIVINPTEALVSIDINSGRSTKEYGIEATALNTNLEAAREIARQLRLRDMAGLVVIDFIDMEYGSNVRKVEKAMKDALKNDRARIQVGRISSFGLMEMSRQRLRTGVLEATTRECPHCDGTGLVRTASSAGLSALRLIEDEAAKGKGSTVSLYASTEAAIYMLNAKRADLADIEMRYGVTVEVIPEGENEGAKMRVLSSGPRPTSLPVFQPIVIEDDDDVADFEDEEDIRDDLDEEEGDDDGGSRRKRRRRRGGKARKGEREPAADEAEAAEAGEAAEGAADSETEAFEVSEDEDGDSSRKRRRRGGRRRRGRGRGGEGEGQSEGQFDDASQDQPIADDAEAEPVQGEVEGAIAATVDEPAAEPEPAPKRRRASRKKVEAEAPAVAEAVDSVTEAEAVAEEAPAKPKRTRRKKPALSEVEGADAEALPEVAEATGEPLAKAEIPAEAGPVEAAEGAPAKPKRTRRKKPALSEAEGAVEDEAVAVAEPAADETPPAEVAAANEPVVPAGDAEPAEAAETSVEEPSDPSGPPRRGWWQRTFGE
jgi:ribonuclease E